MFRSLAPAKGSARDRVRAAMPGGYPWKTPLYKCTSLKTPLIRVHIIKNASILADPEVDAAVDVVATRRLQQFFARRGVAWSREKTAALRSPGERWAAVTESVNALRVAMEGSRYIKSC